MRPILGRQDVRSGQAEMATRSDLYKQDFFRWTEQQAALLRREAARRLNTALDLEHLAEEIESLGRSDRRALTSHLARIIEHLLKLQYSPATEPRAGWRTSVQVHRDEARKLLADSPSLRPYLAGVLEDCYRSGRDFASIGMSEEAVTLPERCPYSLDQILERDWWPSTRAPDGESQARP